MVNRLEHLYLILSYSEVRRRDRQIHQIDFSVQVGAEFNPESSGDLVL